VTEPGAPYPPMQGEVGMGHRGGGRTAGGNRLVRVNGSLLTAGQVAQMLGVPKSWVYEQSRKGQIPTVTLGRYRRYRAETITRWVETLEAGKEQV
jgi:excisionase family DNA binding protein